jgi:hypothetical protein
MKMVVYTAARVLAFASMTLAGADRLSAATYYVDFDGGSDDQAGASPQAAFKHCPGDAEAAGKARAARLAPGDTVVFKGGVDYRGTVTVPFAGAAGKPITYLGDSGGTFGAGKAVIQGAEPVTGWRKVASAADVGGNPNWKSLYVAEIDARHTFFTFSLCQGDAILSCAQDPNPADAFYHDRLDTWLPREAGKVAVTPTTITDDAYFTQKDKDYFDGAYAAVWVRPSWNVYQRITGYDPASHTITFDKIASGLYENSRAKYSLINSLKFLDRPGEYYLDERGAAGGKVRLFLWPPTVGREGPEGVTISARKYGFELQGASHVVIDGFRILQQGGDRAAGIVKSGGGETVGLVLRNNEIARVRTYPNRSGAILMSGLKDSVIEWNYIHENAYCAGLMVTHFDDSVAQFNLLRKNGSTAVDFYNCHGSKLLRNIVRDHLGMHANGLTLYVGCTDVLVEGNEVYNGNGLTTNEGERITVRNNLFDPGPSGANAMGLWRSEPLSKLTIVNNVCLGEIYIGNKGTGWVFRNNVIGGFGGAIQADALLDHNIYTTLGDAQRGRKLAEGEKLVADLKQLFADPAAQDYRPRPGGPLVDAGVDAGVEKDFVDTPRPQGRAVDIGAYELRAGLPQFLKDRADRLAQPAPAGRKGSAD